MRLCACSDLRISADKQVGSGMLPGSDRRAKFLIWDFPKIRGTLFWGFLKIRILLFLGYNIRVPKFWEPPFRVIEMAIGRCEAEGKTPIPGTLQPPHKPATLQPNFPSTLNLES